MPAGASQISPNNLPASNPRALEGTVNKKKFKIRACHESETSNLHSEIINLESETSNPVLPLDLHIDQNENFSACFGQLFLSFPERENPNMLQQIHNLIPKILTKSSKILDSHTENSNLIINEGLLPELIAKYEESLPSIELLTALVSSKSNTIDREEIEESCKEDGLSIPSEVAIGNAEKILEKFNTMKLHYSLYSYAVRDDEILLESTPKHGKSLLIQCNSSGRIDCFLIFDEEKKMVTSSSIDSFFNKHANCFEKYANQLDKAF